MQSLNWFIKVMCCIISKANGNNLNLLNNKIVHHFESFTVAIMNWLTAMEYLCHK